jgi:hypothetical protein
MGISRVTAHKWVRRWRAEGEQGLHDRSSRPRTTPPHRTPATTEAQVRRLRQARKLGPARIGPILGLPASTTHRILTRHGLNRLAHLDRPTGQVIRRYERDRPSELVHVNVKKLGRTPDGGGGENARGGGGIEAASAESAAHRWRSPTSCPPGRRAAAPRPSPRDRTPAPQMTVSAARGARPPDRSARHPRGWNGHTGASAVRFLPP